MKGEGSCPSSSLARSFLSWSARQPSSQLRRRKSDWMAELAKRGSGQSSRLPALLVFLIIISLGEATALILEYQNNSFLRDYVSQNTSLVVSGFLGVGVLGGALAHLVHRKSSAPEGAKGPGIFHRLGDLVTKRHRLVMLAWILIVLASLPLALNVYQVVTSQNRADTSNSESARAQQIISDEFPQQRGLPAQAPSPPFRTILPSTA